jgi:hypothetical protein
MKIEPAPGALDYGIVVEKDVDVPMRDGAPLKADVFRPGWCRRVPRHFEFGSLSEGQALDSAEPGSLALADVKGRGG